MTEGWLITRQVGGAYGPQLRTLIQGPGGQYVLIGTAMPPTAQDELAAYIVSHLTIMDQLCTLPPCPANAEEPP